MLRRLQLPFRATVAFWLLLPCADASTATQQLRQQASLSLPAPLTDADFLHHGTPAPELVELGRRLFFDPILSGNRNISCGTCHDPARGTGDGVSLSIGEGGAGIGPERRTSDGVLARVPRNAQPLYNVGAREYSTMFHDGRLEPDASATFQSGFWSPAREQLPTGLDSLLAAQALFPILSPVEMAGHKGENPIATAVAEDRLAGQGGAWDLLSDRLRTLPAYAQDFANAFDEIDAPADIDITHAARALAAFQTVAFRADGSPFDRALESQDVSLLPGNAQRGLSLFYGEAGCAQCHTGPLLTDHDFHAIAMPQIGPGKGHGHDTTHWRATGFAERVEDEGRYRVTFDPEDLFRFRTPSLRNVALTGPWGHSGAFDSLEDVVRHHLDPLANLKHYGADRAQLAVLPLDSVIEKTGKGSSLIYRPLNPARYSDFRRRDSWVQSSKILRGRIGNANELNPVVLNDDEIDALVAFLHTLTDPATRNLSQWIPDTVPSGLTPQPTPVQNTPTAAAIRP